MTRPSVSSRRAFLHVLGLGAGAAAGSAAAQVPALDAQRRTPPGLYRDPAPGAVAHPLETVLDSENFVSAFRFFTDAQIADAAGYRGQLDLTAPLQTALDAAWSTNRDLFLPAGLYRVGGLVLPGGQATRSRAFRFHGQGSGELFARAEDGGTIVKGIGGKSVLVSRQDRQAAGNGNQEVAYIRFEGNSADAVLDLATLYAQSELHHCGIYQNGSGDGVRIRQANTIEIHHNYVLNRDWDAPRGQRRTGAGFRISTNNDNGLLTMRKNTARGFEWALRLGGEGGGRIYSARIEQCEASTCTSGILLAEGVNGAVVDNCFFEGGDGGIAIDNRGQGNTLRSNYVFPGFAVAIRDEAPSRSTRITGNTLAAGSARTMAPGGCTLIRLNAEGSAKTVEGNVLVCDLDSAGAPTQVVGIEITGREPLVELVGNTFDPARPWGAAPAAAQIVDKSGGAGPRGTIPFGPEGAMSLLARGAVSLGRVVLAEADFAGDTLRLPPGSWFEIPAGARRQVRAIDGGARDGRFIVLWDRHGLLEIPPSALIRLDGQRPFVGPGTLTLLLQAEGGATEALEIARTRF